jgi:hypothetical protein
MSCNFHGYEELVRASADRPDRPDRGDQDFSNSLPFGVVAGNHIPQLYTEFEKGWSTRSTWSSHLLHRLFELNSASILRKRWDKLFRVHTIAER